MKTEREQLYEKLQERRQVLAKEREENRNNVPYQIGRALAYVVMFGVPLAILLWLMGVFA